MGLNVTGTEVASGIHDPSVMISMVFVLLFIGLIIFSFYKIFSR